MSQFKVKILRSVLRVENSRHEYGASVSCRWELRLHLLQEEPAAQLLLVAASVFVVSVTNSPRKYILFLNGKGVFKSLHLLLLILSPKLEKEKIGLPAFSIPIRFLCFSGLTLKTCRCVIPFPSFPFWGGGGAGLQRPRGGRAQVPRLFKPPSRLTCATAPQHGVVLLFSHPRHSWRQ